MKAFPWWKIRVFLLQKTVWQFLDPNNDYHWVYYNDYTKSLKSGLGHCLGCIWYAPKDRCICASIYAGEYRDITKVNKK